MNEYRVRIINMTKIPPSKTSITPQWRVVTDKGTYETRADSAVNYRFSHHMVGTEVTLLMDGKLIAGLN